MKFLLLFITMISSHSFASVTIVSDRSDSINNQLSVLFTQQTGFTADFIAANAKDMKSLLRANSDIDFALVKDFAYANTMLNQFVAMPSMVTQQVQSFAQNSKYVGLTFRARTLIYNSFYPEYANVTSYEQLASPDFKGTLCLRTSSSSYNKGLIASFIQSYGFNTAQEIVSNYVANLATAPFKKDSHVITAVANGETFNTANGFGECRAGVVNSYYLAQALEKNPDLNVEINFLSQNGKGSHVNGYALGMTKSNQENIAFANFMVSEVAQSYLSFASSQFPTRNNFSSPIKVLQKWNGFSADPTPWGNLNSFGQPVSKLIKDANYK